MEELKIFNVIKHALFTNKVFSLNRLKSPKLVVQVEKDANKFKIKKAVELIFGSKVKSINTVNVKGKNKKYGKRYPYKDKDFKKAIITLKDKESLGKAFESYEGEGTKELEVK